MSDVPGYELSDMDLNEIAFVRAGDNGPAKLVLMKTATVAKCMEDHSKLGRGRECKSCGYIMKSMPGGRDTYVDQSLQSQRKKRKKLIAEVDVLKSPHDGDGDGFYSPAPGMPDKTPIPGGQRGLSSVRRNSLRGSKRKRPGQPTKRVRPGQAAHDELMRVTGNAGMNRRGGPLQRKRGDEGMDDLVPSRPGSNIYVPRELLPMYKQMDDLMEQHRVESNRSHTSPLARRLLAEIEALDKKIKREHRKYQ